MPEPILETICLPYTVPYYAQVASPELVEIQTCRGRHIEIL